MDHFSTFEGRIDGSGFSLIEYLVVLALVVVGLGWGLPQILRSWEQQNCQQALKQQIQSGIDLAVATARREGVVVRVRIDEGSLLAEIGESTFSTRWKVIEANRLPACWHFDSGDNLLLLPHGRPADSVQWRFSCVGDIAGRRNGVMVLFYLSGHMEWEKWDE